MSNGRWQCQFLQPPQYIFCFSASAKAWQCVLVQRFQPSLFSRQFEHFQRMIFRNFNQGYSLPVLTFWVAFLSLLTANVTGVSQHKVKEPSLRAVSTATSKPYLLDQDTEFTITKTPVFRENYEHINDLQGEEIPRWTTVQAIPTHQASVRTFDTMTRFTPGSSNTILQWDQSSLDDGEGISGSPSALTTTTTPGYAHDLKRSAGTFMMIKGVLISWAIMLVGMLAYAPARYSEEAFAE